MVTKALLLTIIILSFPVQTQSMAPEKKQVPVKVVTEQSDPEITKDKQEIQRELSHLKVAMISAAVTVSTAALGYGVKYFIGSYLK